VLEVRSRGTHEGKFNGMERRDMGFGLVKTLSVSDPNIELWQRCRVVGSVMYVAPVSVTKYTIRRGPGKCRLRQSVNCSW
jgi:hypothetical protein